MGLDPIHDPSQIETTLRRVMTLLLNETKQKPINKVFVLNFGFDSFDEKHYQYLSSLSYHHLHPLDKLLIRV